MERICVTGAGGFLGQGMVGVLEKEYELTLVDISPFKGGTHRTLVGDIGDVDTARQAVKGCAAVVIAHMASRTTDKTTYDEPPRPFDANVKGTANLFFAAQEAGIGRTVLISSGGAVNGYLDKDFFPHDLPPRPDKDIYCLTKALQEHIAEFYHRVHGMGVAALRIGGIADADTGTSKYGRKFPSFGLELIDRRDIAAAVVKSLQLDNLGFETFWIMGPPEAAERYDMAYTYERLGWRAQYDFSWMK